MNTPTKTLRTFLALACLLCSAALQAAVVCTFNSAALAFASYDASSTTPTDSVGSADVQCNNMDPTTNSGVSVALALSAGANGTISDRKMSGANGLLSYGIYSDAGRTINWGQGMAAVQQSTGPISPNGTKTLRFNLFARIPALQNVRAGTYSDQLLLTVTP